MKKAFVLATSSAISLFAASAFCVDPHLSVNSLPSSNGRAAIAWDRSQNKLDQFLEHPYAYPSSGVSTRNFLYDTYPGVRVGGAGNAGTWLQAVAPTLVEYVQNTSIVHVQRIVSGLLVDEYDFAPITLSDNVAVTLVKVTRQSGTGNIDVYQEFNYHLGSGSPTPGSDSEQATYDATRDVIYEYGPANVTFAYGNLAASTHHAITPDNTFTLLGTGNDLPDTTGTTGATSDTLAGFQSSLGNLAVGASAWTGFYSVIALDSNAAPHADAVHAWVSARTGDQILAAETASWNTWLTAPPASASTSEATLSKASQIVLRSAQVTEPGQSNGQILASLPPGAWNITWVRDMAYSTVALAKTGHYAEAKAALNFQLNATVGSYQSYVGSPYQISVVRYFGNGTEESDSNADGPNIEFDGFGLFLWALNEYVKASGDTAFATTAWTTVSQKVADVLVSLQQETGLIKADSSIWEVHQNGKQRQFTYTSIAAANGLCAASHLATVANDTARAATYLAAGQKARDALLTVRASDGTLAQSVEGLASGIQWLDASVVEAINFGLIYPDRKTAQASLTSMHNGLVPPSGHGFKRSDIPAWYDSQEWVFVDFRAERAMELNGDTTDAASQFAWNVAQGSDNFNELSELHDPTTADYAGQAPMVGFGAGAYLISLADRGTPGTPACGDYANEPGNPGNPDGGTGPTSDGGAPIGNDNDAGVPLNSDGGSSGGIVGSSATPSGSDQDGGCSTTSTRVDFSAMLFAASAWLAYAITRKKKRNV